MSRAEFPLAATQRGAANDRGATSVAGPSTTVSRPRSLTTLMSHRSRLEPLAPRRLPMHGEQGPAGAQCFMSTVDTRNQIWFYCELSYVDCCKVAHTALRDPAPNHQTHNVIAAFAYNGPASCRRRPQPTVGNAQATTHQRTLRPRMLCPHHLGHTCASA